MKVFGRILVAIAAGLLALGNAQAQYTGPITHVSNDMPVEQPFRGIYFDPAKPGTGILLDFGGSTNIMFISYYSYEPDGSQKYYLIQGNYEPKAELTRAQTGVIGSLINQVIYTTSGGEFVGGPYRPSTPNILNIPVSITWTAPRRATMSINGSTWNLVGGDFFGGGNEANYVLGRWGLTLNNADVAGEGVDSQIHVTVDVAPAPFGVNKLTLANGSAQGVALPPSSASLFFVTCVTANNSQKCVNYGKGLTLMGDPSAPTGSQTSTLALWVDPTSGKTGALILNGVTGSGARVGPDGVNYDLYIHVDHMQAHGIVQRAQGTLNGRLDDSLFFERLPAYVKDY